MRRWTRTASGALVALALVATTLGSAAQDLRPVEGFDASRYLGTWHQIAAIPAWFQEQCAVDVTATYNRDDVEGRIRVLNACRTADGTLDQAIGRARFTRSPDIGALDVTFVRLFGAWRWFAAGDYVVIGLGDDYAWSPRTRGGAGRRRCWRFRRR